MPVPNTFANATATIPLSQLDANFATTITLGNTAIQLGNTVSTLNNMTLANVTVSSGNVTITNVTVTTANVTTANIATAQIANVTVSGTGTFAAGSNTAPSITTSGDTNTGIFFPAADTIAFTEGGVESMRIDSAGNMGLGTATPTSTYSARFASVAAAGTSAISLDAPTGTNTSINFYYNGSAKWTTQVLTTGEYRWYDFTAAAERMRLDNSGNLGLGVTPSAWGSTSKALTVRSTGSGVEGSIANSGATNAISLVSNGYYNAGWKYVYAGGSFSAGRYDIEGAGHSWYNAASGTAGNAITFTQAMTLDANGNLVVGGSTALVTSSGRGNITVNGSSTAIVSFGVANASKGYLYHDGTNMSLVSDVSGYLNFATNAIERARITSGGVLVVNGTAATGFNEVINCVGRFVMSEGTQNVSLSNAAILINGSTNNYQNGAYISVDTSNNFSINSRVSLTDTERIRMNPSGITQFLGNIVMPYQGAPTSKSGAATLSGAELITGILNTTGTTYTITLPTGANIEGALTWAGNNVSLDWYVINTASGTITIGANGNTTLGSLTIATGTSAHFRIRRTAANTFTVYRL